MSISRPLIIGEVLFDQLPDGQRVLGGAPFNVAWNLQGLGLAPLLISAVGQDEPGRIVREQMEGWSLDTSALQVSQNRPTGEVHVELEAGQPSFHILNDQAYDEIQLPDFPISDSEFSLLYHGSLAYRNEPSRSTIGHLISASGLPRFVDINIRQPWFDRAWIPDLLSDAQWIKLSDQELAWITELPCETQSEILKATQELKHRYGGRRCLITCGAAGAYAVDEDGDDCFACAHQPPCRCWMPWEQAMRFQLPQFGVSAKINR